MQPNDQALLNEADSGFELWTLLLQIRGLWFSSEWVKVWRTPFFVSASDFWVAYFFIFGYKKGEFGSFFEILSKATPQHPPDTDAAQIVSGSMGALLGF
ncbi:MAG: hypothetical protein AAF847_11255 [Bacteroidota bacterium]